MKRWAPPQIGMGGAVLKGYCTRGKLRGLRSSSEEKRGGGKEQKKPQEELLCSAFAQDCLL